MKINSKVESIRQDIKAQDEEIEQHKIRLVSLTDIKEAKILHANIISVQNSYPKVCNDIELLKRKKAANYKIFDMIDKFAKKYVG